MEWGEFLSQLSDDKRTIAFAAAAQFGEDVARRCIQFQPATTQKALEDDLKREASRVTRRVAGLYESVGAENIPNGWGIDERQVESNPVVLRADISGPRDSRGYFMRGYDRERGAIVFREAFIRLSATHPPLPTMVSGVGVPMISGKGTPTIQYFTLRQLRKLGVVDGAGPPMSSGDAKMIIACSIQNPSTIIHLHWMRQRYPNARLGELLPFTDSVRYSEVTATQCGYRVREVRHLPDEQADVAIRHVLEELEAENGYPAAGHDELLTRYGFKRSDVMLTNFGIELLLAPLREVGQ